MGWKRSAASVATREAQSRREAGGFCSWRAASGAPENGCSQESDPPQKVRQEPQGQKGSAVSASIDGLRPRETHWRIAKSQILTDQVGTDRAFLGNNRPLWAATTRFRTIQIRPKDLGSASWHSPTCLAAAVQTRNYLQPRGADHGCL